MTDPSTLSAAEAARRVQAGTLKARDLAEAMLAVIAAREPDVRAFVHLDPALVRRQADALDAAPRKGPLAGLFFGVKDVLDTMDQPSQYGSPIWAGHRPRNDAACVALARRAGAVIAGKTVTTEFATRHPGATANPHHPGHTPGGSSQGSAAGVGGGMLHLAFGTQTAGSIIRPAAFCGAVGFKPSYGTLHRAGMKVMSESLDTIGIMARSVEDAALAMTALTGVEHGDLRVKPAGGPKLALILGPSTDKAAPETLALMERAAEAARGMGGTVTPVTLPDVFTRAYELHPHVMHMESAEALAWELDHGRAQLSPVMRQNMDWAMGEPRAKLAEGRAAFAAAQAAFDTAIEGYDAVITPAAPGEAPAGLEWTGDPAFNTLWTLLHVPCVTVPAGTGPKGLPLGVQVATRRGEDALCLMWGEWLRQAMH